MYTYLSVLSTEVIRFARGVCKLGVCKLGVCKLGVCKLGVCKLGVCKLGVCKLGVCIPLGLEHRGDSLEVRQTQTPLGHSQKSEPQFTYNTKPPQK
jgi:hypothetical protein